MRQDLFLLDRSEAFLRQSKMYFAFDSSGKPRSYSVQPSTCKRFIALSKVSASFEIRLIL